MTVCLRAKTLRAKTGKDIGAQFSNMHQYHIRAKETPVVGGWGSCTDYILALFSCFDFHTPVSYNVTMYQL